MTLKRPQATYSDDLYRYEWEETGISAVAERFSERGDDISCELIVTSADPVGGGRLYRGRLLLIGPNSLRDVARTCAEKLPGIDWVSIIAQIRDLSLDRYRSGAPLIDLREVELGDAPQFLVYPFMLDHVLSMIYGDGDTAKSVLALTLATIVASGQEIGGLHAERSGPVIYLDWEDDEQQHARRLQALCAAHGLAREHVPVYYQRMSISMQEASREVRRKIAEVSAVAAVIDSAGMASGGDPMDAQAMISSLTAARSLGIPVLVVHHLRKDASKTDKKAPYGSIYSRNEVRLAWLVESQSDAGEEQVKAVYTCTKGNWTGQLEPVRLSYHFTSTGERAQRLLTSLEVRPLGWREATDLPGGSQKWQIVSALKDGAKTVAEIAEITSIGRQRVRNLLLQHEDWFVKVGTDREQRWGLYVEGDNLLAPHRGVNPPSNQVYVANLPPPPPIGAGGVRVSAEKIEEEQDERDWQGAGPF